MARKRAPRVALKKGRRGRSSWSPDLAQVEAAARKGGTIVEIARELGINPATFYRKKQSSREFDEALKRGREICRLDRLNAEFEINAIAHGKLKKKAALLWYLGTRPAWLQRATEDLQIDATGSPNERENTPDPLKVIEMMKPEERQEIETILRRATQRLLRPEVKATTPPLDQNSGTEEVKEPPMRVSADIAEANRRQTAMIEAVKAWQLNLRAGRSDILPQFQPCPKCGRLITLDEEPIWNSDELMFHKNCSRPH